MHDIRPLIPLLLTAGILIGGNGLQGTFIALRGIEEGFSTFVIGMVGTGYFIGFVLGCVYITKIMRAIGHIRAFSALAAIASAASIMMVLLIDPISWFLMRLVQGICFSGLFAVVESWLNARVTNATRARTLSVYRFVDLGSVTAVQYMIPLFGVSGIDLFAIIAMALSLSLVPISFADKSSPAPPNDVKFDIKVLWSVSPLATVGCIVIGLTNSSFRSLGPIYANGIGMSVTSIASFMSIGIFAGIVLQYPLGHYSDKLDRRVIILVSTIGALLASIFLAFLAGESDVANFIGIFAFGAFALPLYSLCSAHANDHAAPGQHALVSAGTLFFWSVGAVVGPLFASFLMGVFGPHALFTYVIVVLTFFAAYTLARIRARDAVPTEERRMRFRSLLRTSTFFSKLATPPNEKDGG